MRDRGAESFIKINLNARAAASRRVGPTSRTAGPRAGPRARFQRANREAGRPQSGVKCVTPVCLGVPIDLWTVCGDAYHIEFKRE